MKKEYMTETGLKLLNKRLAELEQELADLRLFKGTEAIHAGDLWHDNPTLYETESKERVLMRQIRETKDKIERAEIIDTQGDSSTVNLGGEVTLEFEDGTISTYKILGEADSDPSSGVISYKSPLAQAVLGKVVGAKASYSVGDFEEVVIVIAIR